MSSRFSLAAKLYSIFALFAVLVAVITPSGDPITLVVLAGPL